MDEKRILEQLLASAQEIPVPEGLCPEIMEKRLEQTAQKLRTARKSRRQMWQKSLLGAAAVVLCVGLIVLGQRGADSSSSGSMMSFGTASEASDATAGAAAPEEAAAESGAAGGFSASAYSNGTDSWEAEDVGSLYTQAGSYEEIREYLAAAGSVQDDAEAEGANAGDSGTGESKTGEMSAVGDEICTDGSRAYMLEEQTLQILTAGDGGSVTAEEVRLAEIQSGEQLKAVYRDGETLRIVVGTESETRLLTYDISALEQPELLGTVSQEGEYVDSAKWNGSVQLVTKAAVTLPETPESSGQNGETKKTERMAEQEDAEQEWMPQINGQAVSAENSYLSAQGGGQAWLFSAVSEENPGTVGGSGMIVGGSAEICLKGGKAILQEISYTEDEYTTKLAEFELTDDGLVPLGALSLRGIVQESGWIDEQDGYLRVLAEIWNNETEQMEGSVYVLDGDLNPVGILEGLNLEQGAGAVCFDGSRAYISAAGENGGLLLSLDLWEPSSPSLSGELAVDFVSDSLRIWGDGRLLCVGREADTGGASGLRLVMYDCSEPEQGLVELHTWSSAEFSEDTSGNAVKVIGNQEKRILVPDGETGEYAAISYSEKGGFQTEEAP